MFKNQNEDATHRIGEVHKNSREKYIISARQYKGFQFVDVRMFWTDDKGKTWHPSRKGIAISPAIADDILGAIKSGVTFITDSRNEEEYQKRVRELKFAATEKEMKVCL